MVSWLGLSACAEARGVRASDLPWIPDEDYRGSQNLAHRLDLIDVPEAVEPEHPYEPETSDLRKRHRSGHRERL